MMDNVVSTRFSHSKTKEEEEECKRRLPLRRKRGF